MICLVPNCGFLSETSRALAIHQALVARGERTCFLTHGGPYTRVLDEAGVPYTVIGEGWTRARVDRFVAAIPGIGDPRSRLYDDGELEAFVDAEAAFFRERRVTCAVTGFALSTLLSTRVARIPLVTDHAGSFVPPVAEHGLMPAPLESPLPLSRFFPERLSRWLSNNLASRTKLFTGQINAHAKRLGVEGLPSFASLLLGDLTLVTDSPEVLGVSREAMEAWRPDHRYRPDTRLRYVGPLFATLDAEVPADVERLLSRRDDRPVAYVAMTSTSEAMMRAAVTSARDSGMRVVVAATLHDLDDLAGDDVAVGRVLPSHRLMPRCDVAIIAGGQGSVQTAMASGIPFAGVPLQPEQDLNIVEMERHGAARRVSKSRALEGGLGAVAKALAIDPEARAAARRIQAIYAAEDGPRACAEAIVAMLAARGRRPSADAGRAVGGSVEARR